MMSGRSKKHHIVPQTLQKHFAAQDGYVWYSERGADNFFEAPYLQKINKAFVISNYYTVGLGGELSDRVERDFYGIVDDYLGRTLPQIIAAFGEKQNPIFEGKSLVDLRNVVFEMIKRTPDFIKKNDDSALGKAVLDATLKSLKESADVERTAELNAFVEKNPNFMRELGRTIRVRASIKPSDKVEESLKDFSVRWAFCDSKHSYILTSMMVYRIGNGGSNGLANPNCEVWMPISPKIALVLVRDIQNRIPFKNADDPKHVRAVNEFAASNSKQIASHSKELIESVTGKKARASLFK
jgi:Protein of unknown function (DUF4238)